jgi:hypothetical protein
MKDEQIWKEAADGLFEAVNKIEAGEWFNSFNPIKLFNLYLVASLLYYRHSISVMSDRKYDLLCRYLLLRYDRIKEIVWNKELLNKERLQAGTGFDIETYPAPIYCISQHYIRLMRNNNV